LEDQSLIFEKFARSGGGAAKLGTGLGLFIDRSIVEAHGGWLDVESQPDEGSTLTVSCRLASSSGANAEA
jgi:signal transduction histidine kinase